MAEFLSPMTLCISEFKNLLAPNSIEIMVSDMREGLSRDFEQIINETVNNPTESPTTKETDPGTSITS